MSLAPINQVPVEVLVEIFHAYCQDIVSDLPPMNNIHPADTLSAVCSKWRDIIQNTSKIWSFINLTGPLDMEPSENLMTIPSKSLNRCLKMSRNVPLHIGLLSDVSGSPFTSLYNTGPLIKMALQHSSRWQSASLDLVPFIAKKFAKFIKKSSKSQEELFPALQRLHVFTPDLYIPSGAISFPLQRPSLPQLTEFSVSCQNAAQHPNGSVEHNLSVDPAITSLEVCDRFHDEDLTFMDEVTGLRQLCLRQYVGGLTHYVYSSHTLHRLVIRVYVRLMEEVTLSIFSKLTLPALTSLEISQFGTSPNIVWSSLSFDSMIQRSGCALRSLYIEDVQIDYENLVKLIYSVSALEEFTFHERGEENTVSDIGHQLCRLLVWDKDLDPVPRLKDLELRVYSSLNDDLLDSISDLIVSRISSEFGLPANLTYFRYHPLFGSSSEDPDSVMHLLEDQARKSIPNCSGVSFRVILPPEMADSEDDGDDSDDSSSIAITEDSEFGLSLWEEDFPSDNPQILAEETVEGELDILPFEPGVSTSGEFLIGRYYRENEEGHL